MPNILFELISPERVLLSGEVTMVIVPTREGDTTVMPDQEPMIATLNPGTSSWPTFTGMGTRPSSRAGS